MPRRPYPVPQGRPSPLTHPRAFFGCAVVGGVGAGRGGFWVVPGGVPGVTPWVTHSSTPAPTRRVTHSPTRGIMPSPMPRGTPSITPKSYGWVRCA